MNKIGVRIKYRRIALGLTQLELAKKMGYTSKAAICKVENGQDNLTTDRVRKFADALECKPEDLMGWSLDDDSVKQIERITTYQDSIETQQAKELYEKYKDAPVSIKNAINNLLGLEW